jgi:hypothetical protein
MKKKKNWHHRDLRSCGKCGIILKNKFEKRFDNYSKTIRQVKIKYCPRCGWSFQDK